MMPDKVLYTDGHDVTVTDSTLQVKNHEYKLNGITKCVLMVLRPERTPGFLMLALGVALILCGATQLLSRDLIADIAIGDRYYTANTLAIWIGSGLVALGILAMALVKERYAVRIATAEGEKDAVVSTKKEYISQIVDSINQAVSFVRTKTASRYFTVKGSA